MSITNPIPKTNSRRVLLVFLISLCVHLLYVALPSAEWNRYEMDDGMYEELASNIARHGKFSIGDDAFGTVVADEPTYFWTPMYPMFLALMKKVGAGVRTITFIQAILVTLSVFPVYIILRSFLSGHLLWAVLVAWALYPFGIVLPRSLASETLAMVLEWTVIALLIVSVRRGRLLWYAGAGIVLGLLVLTRPERMIQTLFLGLWLLPGLIKGRVPQLRKGVAVLGLCFLGILAPWIIRNHHVSGALVFTSRAPINLLSQNYFWELQTTGNSHLVDSYFDAHPTTGAEIERSQQLMHRATSYITDNPLTYARLCAKRLISMHVPSIAKKLLYRIAGRKDFKVSKPMPPPWQGANLIFLLLFYLVTLPGLIALFRMRHSQNEVLGSTPGLLLCLGLAQLVTITLVAGIVYQRAISDMYWISTGAWALWYRGHQKPSHLTADSPAAAPITTEK